MLLPTDHSEKDCPPVHVPSLLSVSFAYIFLTLCVGCCRKQMQLPQVQMLSKLTALLHLPLREVTQLQQKWIVHNILPKAIKSSVMMAPHLPDDAVLFFFFRRGHLAVRSHWLDCVLQ